MGGGSDWGCSMWVVGGGAGGAGSGGATATLAPSSRVVVLPSLPFTPPLHPSPSTPPPYRKVSLVDGRVLLPLPYPPWPAPNPSRLPLPRTSPLTPPSVLTWSLIRIARRWGGRHPFLSSTALSLSTTPLTSPGSGLPCNKKSSKSSLAVWCVG